MTTTKRPIGIRLRGACLGFVAVTTAALMTAGAQTGMAAETAPSTVNVPVGTWSGTVTRDGVSEQNTMSFSVTGKVCLTTTGGGRGSGTWRPTGLSAFSYRATEQLLDANGKPAGRAEINQDARQPSQTVFHSTGITQIFGPDGTRVGQVRATVDAKRTSPVPFSC